jgi:hypothetical protein
MAEPNGKKVIDASLEFHQFYTRTKWAIRSGVSKAVW